jgi:hypothetical protein
VTGRKGVITFNIIIITIIIFFSVISLFFSLSFFRGNGEGQKGAFRFGGGEKVGGGFFREKGRVFLGGKRDREVERKEVVFFGKRPFSGERVLLKDRFGKKGAEKPRGGANFNLSLPLHPSNPFISFFISRKFLRPQRESKKIPKKPPPFT